MKTNGIIALILAVLVASSAALDMTITASASVTLISGDRVCGACAMMAVSDASIGALLKFDLSVLPSDAQITQASLTLPFAQQGSGLPQINVKAVERAWNQSVVSATTVTVGNPPIDGDPTWEAASYPWTNWTTPGGGSGAALTLILTTSNGASDISSAGLSSASLLSLVQGWKANAATNFGLSLTVRSGSSGLSYFGSRLNANTALRPTLAITYTSVTGAPPPPVQPQNFAGAPRYIGYHYPSRYGAPSTAGAIVGGVIGGVAAIILIISVITIVIRS